MADMDKDQRKNAASRPDAAGRPASRPDAARRADFAASAMDAANRTIDEMMR